MGLFTKLLDTTISAIDWEMTPEYTFGTFESWGGKERVRSKHERVYYFFIDAWGDAPKLCLMERGIKHARIIAEILAPVDMVQRCVKEQGKVALFERTHPINEELKQWLITYVLETDDDSKIMVLERPADTKIGPSGLPLKSESISAEEQVHLPDQPAEMSEEEVLALIKAYGFSDQERNPEGTFTHGYVDNGDGLTITDLKTGLMWQRAGTDIMSNRSMRREVARINDERFAGHSDWRLPTMAEALSLLEREKKANDQYLHPCFTGDQPFVFVEATRKPGGYWFVDFKQGRAFWSSGTIPGGFGRLCRKEK